MTGKHYLTILLIMVIIIWTACAPKQKTTIPAEETDKPEDTIEETQIDEIPVEEDIINDILEDDPVILTSEYVPDAQNIQDVFFVIDRYDLTQEARTILDRNIEWLKRNPRSKVLLEGHCCDIGTVEYNYALGDRRANSVRDYLIMNGIDPSRITTISYGKMNPFVIGTAEHQRQKNRRVHFKIQR